MEATLGRWTTTAMLRSSNHLSGSYRRFSEGIRKVFICQGVLQVWRTTDRDTVTRGWIHDRGLLLSRRVHLQSILVEGCCKLLSLLLPSL